MTESIITDIKKCSKCDNKVKARGLCGYHYNKECRNGDFKKDILYGNNMDIKERLDYFSEKVTESGCQIWTNCTKPSGHGQIRIGGITKYAHRISYETYVGVIPEGLFVCHKCDVPSCINPDHLFLGTQQDNMADMVSKNRQARGEKKILSSKLTNDKIIEIRNDTRLHKLIAKDYGVMQPQISNIKNRKTWSHVL